MLRFPNPSSTIRNFVGVYRVAHQELAGSSMEIDDIVSVIVGENLATSSGYVGDEAILRSTRQDRSRDPLYNQIKMYTELFRILGWIHSTAEKALRFTFTPLGNQVAIAGPHYAGVLGESALGITYPNPNMRSQRGNHDIRPFHLLLRTMVECDDELSRDEMIIGPLSAESDRSKADVDSICAHVLDARARRRGTEEALHSLSEEFGVQINTLKNYTRWPIALMRDLGWTTRRTGRARRTLGPTPVFVLTALGKEIARRAGTATDLRATQLSSLNYEELRALATFAHYRMMERADFDVSVAGHLLDRSREVLSRTMAKLAIRPGSDILFSPFQALPIADVQQIFGESEQRVLAGARVAGDAPTYLASVSRLASLSGRSAGGRSEDFSLASDELIDELRQHFEASEQSSEHAARRFVDMHSEDSKDVFYPLIADLFRLLGLRCDVSRSGVHSQRWDACLWTKEDLALPIEIKSPAEETALSTKALRQAVENKIILLARGNPPTDRDSASLVVGYQLPSDRSDLSRLVEDVFGTYGVRIGIIAMDTLVVAGIRRLCEGVEIDVSVIGRLKGLLHV